MSGLVIPDGLEPLAVWDAEMVQPYAFAAEVEARSAWARAHLGDPEFIYRAEFYLFDTPFAVVHRFARNAHGFKYHDPDGEVATEPPVIVPLGELPPAHLLGRP